MVGDFRGARRLAGFFLQDPDGDGDHRTSDGLFVCAPRSDSVRAGDSVEVSGMVGERRGVTCILASEGTPVQITKIPRMGRVDPLEVRLPVPSPHRWEDLEGMLLTFPQTLTVTENYNLGRYGEVTLSAPHRLFVTTNQVDPNDDPAAGTTHTGTGNVAKVNAGRDLNRRRSIILDDGSDSASLRTVPYINRSPNAPQTLRAGSVVDGITGVLSSIGGKYRVHPTVSPVIHYAPRPAKPAIDKSANLTVAVFNIWNYFTTIDDGDNEARGADSESERDRQRAKIIAALTAIDADIFALAELEQNDESLEELTSHLNQTLVRAEFQAVAAPVHLPDVPGSGIIKVGILYKPDCVTVAGDSVVMDAPAFRNARPPIAQTFRLNRNGEMFTVVVNHFKSKRADGASGLDKDQNDGQAAFNDARRRQSEAVLQFVQQLQAASGDKDVLVVGDLNAYAEEDPVDRLRDGGLVDQLQRFSPEEAYSYVYDGEAGQLDHVFATPGLREQVLSAAVWHINADEPSALDYNDDVKDTSSRRDTLRWDPTLYRPDAFRSSDHDPIIVGLRLHR
ncbi:MAG: ExeM/NucH family extracellular endonuclease [Pirellulaceae bacterium]